MAVLEQQRGEPELLNELPKLVGEVTAEQIADAAAALRPQRRAAVEVQPGATR
jgi:zinc protease